VRGQLVDALQHKASGRFEHFRAGNTSQRLLACGHVGPETRKSQAVFECEPAPLDCATADFNAARTSLPVRR